ncbi:Uma2 family endonuclease [Kribbella antiqua]|uniref:Uma2 family endonuclease n=1 Tax=Kribbella antiqua TaxID=2512217 RepID=UPI001F545D8B|nr:Uma2 family endonuclease [Kribbella antiqua]
MRPIEPDEFTTADLEVTPDDGMRYELVDGVLIITSTPPTIHQRALGELCFLLAPVCPEDLEVLHGVEFRPHSRLALVPDLVVFRCDDIGVQWLEGPLLLAVEILSPATRTVDQVFKRKLYETAGVASYWMFDPDEVRLTALELEEGRYVERAVVSEDEVFEAEIPFPVKVVPAELIR